MTKDKETELLAVEALQEIARRTDAAARINLGGKTPDAKLVGTLRNVNIIVHAALAVLPKQARQ